jgi:hypothetical protein
MTKQVALFIDRESWANASAEFQHPCPSTFPNTSVTDVSFLGSLLQLGTLTVPWRGAACSLAVYWAYVRYCAAIDPSDSGLRLKEEWSDLDSHQITILSDDWGVGFTTHWLASRLCFQSYCDGRFFIEQLSGLNLATVNRPPGKQPEQGAGSQRHRREAFSHAIAAFSTRAQRDPERGWYSRTIDIPFPQPIAFGDGRFRSVKIAHAVSGGLLERLSHYNPSERTLARRFPEAELSQLGWSSFEDEYAASIHREPQFQSELSLVE